MLFYPELILPFTVFWISVFLLFNLHLSWCEKHHWECRQKVVRLQYCCPTFSLCLRAIEYNKYGLKSQTTVIKISHFQWHNTFGGEMEIPVAAQWPSQSIYLSDKILATWWSCSETKKKLVLMLVHVKLQKLFFVCVFIYSFIIHYYYYY